MEIPLQKGQGKVKQIKVEGNVDGGQEVIVRHEIGSLKWKAWNHDDFSRDWQKNIPSRKGK
jgi:hypothetical protein